MAWEAQLRLYSPAECDQWLSARQRRLPEGFKRRLAYPKERHRTFSLAYSIAHTLPHRTPALLWITESGIWPSSENWHLYYRLRQSYGDARLLEEAPGHLFLAHEAEDCASFLQLAMLNGWGGYVLTEANYVNAFFSHDEYIDVFAENEETLAPVLSELDIQCGHAT